ncbi:MAG TPA: hypothetical protein VMG35_01700 [Bryobacteraceae bacterium]|nr:hypothetical protein [Bryobacteraceae bacterium]
MPTIVTASTGDTLCNLAMDAGFINCQPLRDEAANSAFLNRPLKDGDRVTIPDTDPGEQSGSTDAKHNFQATNSPPVSIRFVHGSPDKTVEGDDTLQTLDVSNYRTTAGGKGGTQAFPSGFGFNALGDADLDAFKVEVTDPQGGGKAHVILEALKPVYQQDPATSALTAVDFVPFTGAEHDRRKVEFDCQHATATRYRSTYLRLVVDDDAGTSDKQALPAQTLLVTDLADGLGTGDPDDNDSLEILDQQVRASYVIPRCPAAAPNQCTVTAQVPIGTDRQRIRIVIHIFRANVGDGDVGLGGITDQMVRKRALRWFRRVYAQAGMAPKFVFPEVDFLDPPEDNMLVLSNETGNMAFGDSTLSFTLSSSPPPPPGSPPDPVVSIPLFVALSPTDVGNLVQNALPAGFQAQVFTNPRTFNGADSSCDVLITRTDGTRVSIQNETTDDALMTVTVARVNLAAVAAFTGNNARDVNNIIACTPEHRRVVRSAPGTGTRLDFYVVGDLTGPTVTPGVQPPSVARGLAMLVGKDLAAPFTSVSPIQWGALLATRVMDASDNNPFSFPHEAGHVMLDTFHAHAGDPLEPVQLMRNGTSAANNTAGSKRLCDSPALCAYDAFDPAQPTPGAAIVVQKVNAVQRLRDKGSEVQEAW